MIDLSIIIPHFNSPDTLQRLIDSIPNVPNFEIVVIDDNSTKGIEQLKQCIEQNKSRNILFDYVELPLKGAGAARNKGLSLATGKWVLFADADDFFLEGFEKSVSECFGYDVNVIYFPPTSVDIETGEVSERHVHYANLVKNYIQNSNLENENLLRYQYWTPWSKLIRKDFIDRNKICFDNVLYSNDVMFSTKIGVLLETFQVVDKEIYCVTQSKESLTSVKNEKSKRIRTRVLCNYYFYLHRNLEKGVMQQLGYTCKDFWYFTFYKYGLVEMKDMILSKFRKTGV